MPNERQRLIRNFCIIAHIDHGKSTLADRVLELTGVFTAREMEEQILDSMDLERERGITIKSRAVRMRYTATDGENYIFNLIDTPGHVDFTYEVSRSLAACEGAILIVDATQGVEAQTLANAYLAIDNNLEVLPVINKIDLASADIENTRHEIEDIIGIDASAAPAISAKEGTNITQVLEDVIKFLPPPEGDEDAPLQAMIFDSLYDNYRGAICYVRMVSGTVKADERIRMMSTGKVFDVTEVGAFTPSLMPLPQLAAGDVGYILGSIKDVSDTRVGDTITHDDRPASHPLPGYKEAQPMVFCGIYPADGADYEDVKESLEKLKLNDASFRYEQETSAALGFGFRCGFLGLLHMEVITERLEREFDLDLITTAPSVVYKVKLLDGQELSIDNPSNMPEPNEIASMSEPVAEAHIITPKDYTGAIMELCQERRGVFVDMKYLDAARVQVTYHIPLNEIIYDFFDAIKSRTKGYASLDYSILDYVESDLVKLDILLNGDLCDALSTIVHKDRAYTRGRKLAEKLVEVIPRQMFEIPVQACIGGKIIARETVKAFRKDVLSKCYGGDITRKKKLLSKQKEGKKRMRQMGSVSVPSDAFMSVLRLDG